MNRRVQIIIGLAIVVLSSLRIYNATQQKKDRENQRREILDLSDQQLEDRMERDQEVIDKIPDLGIDLDSAKQSLDQIGKDLEKLKL